MYGVKQGGIIATLLLWGLLLCSPPVFSAPIQVLTYEVSPFAVQIGNQKHGLLVDLLAELFKRAALEYEIKFVPLKRAMRSVEQTADQCVMPVNRSQEREVNFQWISPVLVSRYGLFSHPEDNINIETMDDAKPYLIGSFRGAGIGEYLMANGFKVDLTSTNEQSYWKLQRKRISLWASELISARQIMLKDGQALKPMLVFYTSLSAMACNRNLSEDKVRKLKLALSGMYRSGFINQLYRYYGLDI